ncbi:Krr1 Small Subunit Processome Component [Manis pentadactyla]|nr:Krr1 Small Subunit Processome Component [Manis pentadactyla]
MKAEPLDTSPASDELETAAGFEPSFLESGFSSLPQTLKREQAGQERPRGPSARRWCSRSNPGPQATPLDLAPQVLRQLRIGTLERGDVIHPSPVSDLPTPEAERRRELTQRTHIRAPSWRQFLPARGLGSPLRQAGSHI